MKALMIMCTSVRRLAGSWNWSRARCWDGFDQQGVAGGGCGIVASHHVVNGHGDRVVAAWKVSGEIEAVVKVDGGSTFGVLVEVDQVFAFEDDFAAGLFDQEILLDVDFARAVFLGVGDVEEDEG